MRVAGQMIVYKYFKPNMSYQIQVKSRTGLISAKQTKELYFFVIKQMQFFFHRGIAYSIRTSLLNTKFAIVTTQ